DKALPLTGIRKAYPCDKTLPLTGIRKVYPCDKALPLIGISKAYPLGLGMYFIPLRAQVLSYTIKMWLIID
ncbi:MAG: hypothetical protein KJ838_01305, partial [Candidatus Omnitrophica bacterium]|nr:hypothetical protein [Candidatus Omnitrophota bacterium]